MSKSWLRSSQVWSWALYDWANSAFATSILAGFFPIFFKSYWCQGASAVESTTRLGYINSLSSLVIVVLAPILGGIASHSYGLKRFLLLSTLLGALASISLVGVAQGQWELAAALFALASIGFFSALTFYDALLVHVTGTSTLDQVSAFGYSLGYLGGGILLGAQVLTIQHPDWFGLEGAADAVRLAFFTVGAWWLVFSIPIFRFVREPRKPQLPLYQAAKEGLRSAIATTKKLWRSPPLRFFLLAYLVYIDGVNTIIRMAVDYGMSLGLDSNQLIAALLVVQFVGFPSSLAWGKFATQVGARSGIFVCLALYALVSLGAFFITSTLHFWSLAVLIGLIQGGIQSLSRSEFAKQVPPEHSAEYFAFFNLLGKFSSLIGPLLVGVVSSLANDTRWGILTPILFFALGAYWLTLASHRIQHGE